MKLKWAFVAMWAVGTLLFAVELPPIQAWVCSVIAACSLGLIYSIVTTG